MDLLLEHKMKCNVTFLENESDCHTVLVPNEGHFNEEQKIIR
jgi:hypothetical protein